MRIKTKDIALMGILMSIMLIFVLIPITFGAIDMAFLALVPIIVASQTKGWRYGLFMSIAFGFASFSVAFMGRSVLSPIFQNPLVSILPRIFIGIVVCAIGKLTQIILAKSKIKASTKKSIEYTVSSIAGVCANTVLVLGTLLLIYHGKIIGGINIGWALILGILSTNFVIELAVCAVVCMPISMTVNKLLKVELK